MRCSRILGRPLVAALVVAVLAAADRHGQANEEPAVRVVVTGTLSTDLAVTSLAMSANGQTAYSIDGRRGAIVAIDVGDPTRRRDVVAAVAEGSMRPVAVGAIPGGVLVAVCREGDRWEACTYRPGPTTPATEPVQRFPLGEAAGEPRRVGVVASTSRAWLAITGLPAPLPPLLRGIAAGVSIRFLAADERREADVRPVAAAVSPDDALVVFDAAGDATATMTFLDPAGRTLLHLDTGLEDVRAASFSRPDGRLWVLTGSAGGRPAGLWRLDAEIRDGLQAVRPVRAATLTDPRAVVGLADDALLVAEGDPVRLVTIAAVEKEDDE